MAQAVGRQSITLGVRHNKSEKAVVKFTIFTVRTPYCAHISRLLHKGLLSYASAPSCTSPHALRFPCAALLVVRTAVT